MKLNISLDAACLWFADAVVGMGKSWNKHGFGEGFNHGRLSTARMIIMRSITQRNRKAIGLCIAAKLKRMREA